MVGRGPPGLPHGGEGPTWPPPLVGERSEDRFPACRVEQVQAPRGELQAQPVARVDLQLRVDASDRAVLADDSVDKLVGPEYLGDLDLHVEPGLAVGRGG